jgi:signal peptidase II
MGPLFVGLSIVAIILIPLMHRRFVRTADLWQAFGLGAIEAGALGNLYDRLVYGSVRDFLVLHWGPHAWPTFNVADALICAGLAALFISTCRKPHRDGPPTGTQGPS